MEKLIRKSTPYKQNKKKQKWRSMDWRESKMERGTGCLGNTSQVYGVAHGDAPSGVPPVATKPVGLERANE